MTQRREGAKAIHRAIDVLDAFTMDRQAITAPDLAQLLSIPLPTAHRITSALTERGYLTRDESNREFFLGPSILRLASVATGGRRGYAHLASLLERLREEFGETVGLHIRAGDRRVCVRELESPHRVRVVSGVGQTYPLTAGAASKVLLTHLSAEDIAPLLAALPSESRDNLQASVTSTRQLGYATSHAETIDSSRAVAAKVPDLSGAPAVVVNIAGPESRMTPERLPEIGRRLLTLLHDHDMR